MIAFTAEFNPTSRLTFHNVLFDVTSPPTTHSTIPSSPQSSNSSTPTSTATAPNCSPSSFPDH